jgi:hypothetical protein
MGESLLNSDSRWIKFQVHSKLCQLQVSPKLKSSKTLRVPEKIGPHCHLTEKKHLMFTMFVTLGLLLCQLRK